MRRETRVAVIGAGLGGMTVAGLLQRAGFTVRVYEQAAAFSRIGAGIHLSANVMVVMRRLGIEGALSDLGLHPGSFVSRHWDTGEILFALPLDANANAHYGAPYVNVHRGDLHAVLESALAHGTVAFGARLASVDDTGGAVRLVFADGREAEADLVIGADGVNSRIRAALLGDTPPRYTGHVAHRAIYPTARLPRRPDHACTKWWGPDRHILAYYMTNAREEIYLVSSVPEPDWTAGPSFVPCDRDAFVAAFEGFHPELREIAAAAPEVTVWPVFDRDLAAGWSAGRLVLLGDACHPLRPYMAQGAAMAIEDGAILARCLAEVGDDDPAEAFAVYEATRWPRLATVQRISVANTWLRGPTDPDWLFTYDACTAALATADAPRPGSRS